MPGLGLPRYLRPGLRAVFIGANPSVYSAEAGHYYARPGNAFWRQLSKSGLIERAAGPEDDALLMDEAGIGFTDLCSRPTVRAGELTRAEIIDGVHRLHGELLENEPRVAVFNSRDIYRQFGRHILGLSTKDLAARQYGPQPEHIGETILWVIPSSSGLASKWHGERLGLLLRLTAELGSG